MKIDLKISTADKKILMVRMLDELADDPNPSKKAVKRLDWLVGLVCCIKGGSFCKLLAKRVYSPVVQAWGHSNKITKSMLLGAKIEHQIEYDLNHLD